jgi:pimeloyl-ACP methyl ester carboxylesterase
MARSSILRWLLITVASVVVLTIIAATALIVLIDPDSQAADRPQRVTVSELSRYAEIPFDGTDGITLHYLDSGPTDNPGPALVLLHGFTFNAFSWLEPWEQLAQHRRVIALDQLPYGLSEKAIPGDWSGSSPYAREAAVALTLGLLDRLGLERVVLVGNSSGGTLAAELALAAPERVAGLVLVAPWIYASRPVLPHRLASSPPLERLSLFIGRQLGERMPLLDNSFASPGRISEARRRLARVHTRTRNWDLAWGALINQSLHTPIEIASAIDRLEQPVLVISGDLDRLVPVEDSRRLAGALPNADLVLLEGCGHVAHEECPDAFVTAIDDWLGPVRGADDR